MIKKLIEKTTKTENEPVQYDFKEKYEGIAGTCPDCGDIVYYDSVFYKYVCVNLDCGFEANIKRQRKTKNNSSNSEIKTEKSL